VLQLLDAEALCQLALKGITLGLGKTDPPWVDALGAVAKWKGGFQEEEISSGGGLSCAEPRHAVIWRMGNAIIKRLDALEN